jgi:hypothetical protein
MRQTRAARMSAADNGTLTGEIIEAMLDNAISCPYCRATMSQDDKSVDHMDPLARGGLHSIFNVTICCKACNTKKSSRSFVEWLKVLNPQIAQSALEMFKRISGSEPRQLQGIIRIDAEKKRRRPRNQQVRSSGRFWCVATNG